MWVLTLLLLVLILGIIILVHEFGHFFWAKKFGVHIYEFSIGMGPIIYKRKGKDNIDYNLRAVPIGGFVSMAGEVYEDNNDIDKDKFMCNKPWLQRVIVLVAGVANNFLLAILLLFVGALIWGGNTLEPIVEDVVEGYPMADSGVVKGDRILEINGYNISSWDVAQIVLSMKNKNKYYTFVVEHQNGKEETIKVVPKMEKNEETEIETPVFGVQISTKETESLWDCIKYAFKKFGSVVHSMWLTVTGLITGKISLKALSGPVGIYQVVDQSVSYGLDYIIYIIAFLSINVGFINILPFPAFDGGRVLFLLIEKIKGSPINSKFENLCHMVGFILLIILMIYITIQDVIRIV